MRSGKINVPNGELLPFDLERLNDVIARYSDRLDDEIWWKLDEKGEIPAWARTVIMRRIRLDKLAEEVGEVQEEIIALPKDGTSARVQEELLDVALTALLAFYHESQQEFVMERFAAYLQEKARRYAGIV